MIRLENRRQDGMKSDTITKQMRSQDLHEEPQLMIQDVIGATPCKPVMHSAHEVSDTCALCEYIIV